MRRQIAALVSIGLLLGACTQAAPPGSPVASGSASGPEASEPAGAGAIPNCADLRPISAPDGAYRDTPIYVANEMPTEEIRAWANGKPGFEDIWIDREHNGWLTVAFSEGAEERQRELAAEFPGVGVVAVAVDWKKAELEALQQRVVEELGPIMSVSVGSGGNYGIVFIGVGVLTADRIAEVERRFGGERVCVEGQDPADLPAPGPQAPEGDGWRLLADEKTGNAYRTGIAWDDASLAALWGEAGVSAPPPAVDWATEVVIWFGAVYSGSCPNIRLDAVVTQQDRRLVHAEIVQVDPPAMCTADANPRAYVVAYERAKLPLAPFSIQLGAEDPPGGVPEERTVVDADLRGPGSAAAPGQVHGDPNLPAAQYVEPGGSIEPEFEAQFRMPVQCGIEWLGPLNNVMWRTDVPPDAADFVPPEWEPVVADEAVILTLLMQTGDPPTLTASANGYTVTYRATADDRPGCD